MAAASKLKTSKEAQAYIKELKQQLEDRGLLQNVDLLALIMIEVTYDSYIKASQFLLENGTTYEVTSREGNISFKEYPQCKLQHDNQVQLTKLLTEFGCTTSSRKKVKNMGTETTDFNPLEEFIKNK